MRHINVTLYFTLLTVMTVVMTAGVAVKCLITPHVDDKGDSLSVVVKKSTGIMGKIIGDVTKRSALQQTVIGAASGGLAGFLCGRGIRLAAVGLGVSIIVIQVAQHNGYIKIDWAEVEEDVINAKESISNLGNNPEVASAASRYLNETVRFVKNNVFLACGFGSGFLIGVSV